MSDYVQRKDRELREHIKECINLLRQFQVHSRLNPEFEMDVQMLFAFHPEDQHEATSIITSHLGDKAVFDVDSEDSSAKALH